MIRTYSELTKLKTFKERYEYLKLNGTVGKETFGFDRYLNQVLYKSSEWKRVRNEVLLRDNGCDLGFEGKDIFDKVIIHHMNPIRQEDIINRNPDIFNPEYLISVSFDTHQAIHFGDEGLLKKDYEPRFKGDTKLW